MSRSEENDYNFLPHSLSLPSYVRYSFTIGGETSDASRDSPRPRASKVSIEAMPKVTVTSDEEKICSICLDGLKVGDEGREMPCKHMFHGACIQKWMARSTLCPLCRFSLPAESEESFTWKYLTLISHLLSRIAESSDDEEDNGSERNASIIYGDDDDSGSERNTSIIYDDDDDDDDDDSGRERNASIIYDDDDDDSVTDEDM